jgi:hypothetical protein
MLKKYSKYLLSLEIGVLLIPITTLFAIEDYGIISSTFVDPSIGKIASALFIAVCALSIFALWRLPYIMLFKALVKIQI